MADHQFVVWPENQEAVQVFLILDPDWETPGSLGGDFRLATTEIEAGIRLSQVEDPRECWQKIQLMKRAAAKVLRERHRAK